VPPTTQLSVALRNLRKARGLTQAQLAEATRGEVSESLIGHIETSRRLASIDTIRSLARAMQLSAEERQTLFTARGNDRANTKLPGAEDEPSLAIGPVTREEFDALASRVRALELANAERLADEALADADIGDSRQRSG
jgi:transcriptional regulator with XRE-family HTH domain